MTNLTGWGNKSTKTGACTKEALSMELRKATEHLNGQMGVNTMECLVMGL